MWVTIFLVSHFMFLRHQNDNINLILDEDLPGTQEAERAAYSSVCEQLGYRSVTQ